jgi:hypothetical protein
MVSIKQLEANKVSHYGTRRQKYGDIINDNQNKTIIIKKQSCYM